MTGLNAEAGRRLELLSWMSPEVGWNAFQVATLSLLHDLRERARALVAREDGSLPEEVADELLDQVRELGARGGVHPGLVEQTVDGIQAALYRHIGAPARWGSWAALQEAMQEAADSVAVIVTGIADEMSEIRDEYERTAEDEDAPETITSMNRVIDHMRMIVAAVQATGEPAQG